MYVFMCVCMYVFMYVCMYVCMYVWVGPIPGKQTRGNRVGQGGGFASWDFGLPRNATRYEAKTRLATDFLTRAPWVSRGPLGPGKSHGPS